MGATPSSSSLSSATTSSSLGPAAGVKPRTFSRQLGFQRSQSANSVSPGSGAASLYGTLPKGTPYPSAEPPTPSSPSSTPYTPAMSQSYAGPSSPLASAKKSDNALAKQLDSLGHSSPLLEAFATLNNALNRQDGAQP
jgi:hypothetical protein